jgi:C1A family cysteine protease
MQDMNCLFTPQVRLPSGETFGTGWLPPTPDFRDYTHGSAAIAPLSRALRLPDGRAIHELRGPAAVDLRAWCSPVENQGQLGSCTANAAAGIVEYFERRAFGKYFDASRLFIYKTTRDLLQVHGDTGAWLRNVMAALAYFGVAPEKYWPYTDASPAFDAEPSTFVYEVADNYESLSYFCHDPITANVPGAQALASVKAYLAAGIPSMFGFWGFPSFSNSDVKGGIPYPGPAERAQWGHAICAMGYDDAKRITNTLTNKATTGALLIRNSWGTGWGDAGYGWLPYDYVANKLALDFWSLLRMEWVQTGNFGMAGI